MSSIDSKSYLSYTSSISPSIASFSSTNDSSSHQPKSLSSQSGISTAQSGTSITTANLYIQAGLLEAHWSRRFMFNVVTSIIFNSSILLIILFNTIILSIQITPVINLNYGWYLSLIDQIFLGIYITETVAKLYVFRLTYFRYGWNNFDFCIVVSSIVTFALNFISVSLSSFNPKIVRLFRIFRTLRAIRSLRALRAITFMKNLQVLVEALLSSLPAMSSITALAGLVLYIFSVIARASYSSYDSRRFGTLGTTIFWLFSTVTLDQWGDIWLQNSNAPGIFAFLCSFMVLENFVLLNLFIAVMASNLDSSRIRMNKLRRRDNQRENSVMERLKKIVLRSIGGGSIEEISINAVNSREDSKSITDNNAQRVLDLPIISSITPSQSNMATEVEESLHIANLKFYEFPTDLYYPSTMNRRDKQLLATIWQLIVVLEHEMAHYYSQSGVVEKLVELLVSSTNYTTNGRTALRPIRWNQVAQSPGTTNTGNPNLYATNVIGSLSNSRQQSSADPDHHGLMLPAPDKKMIGGSMPNNNDINPLNSHSSELPHGRVTSTSLLLHSREGSHANLPSQAVVFSSTRSAPDHAGVG